LISFIAAVGIYSTTAKVKSLVNYAEVTNRPRYLRTDEENALADAQALTHEQVVLKQWRIIDFSMSVGLSAISTAMICARLLLMRKSMKRIAAGSATFRPTLPYTRLMAIILESALPFTFVGIAGAITTGLMDYHGYNAAMHLYPIMVVLWINALVRLQRLMEVTHTKLKTTRLSVLK
jgi:hypothetical protein